MLFIPIDVTRTANGFRSRAKYFVSMSSSKIPLFPKGMCYNENHTNIYFKPHSNVGFVGSSSVSSSAMRRRGV
jgi:hypothetical protein